MEKPELDYDAISIDTSIFDKSGVALEKGLLKQLEQFAQGPVRVTLSEIVHHELKNHLTKRIQDARSALQTGLNKISNELLVSPDAIELAKLSMSSTKPDGEIADERLKAFYQKTSAVIISTKHASFEDVVHRYFETKPPFEEKKDKKSEFPDAIALSSLEGYAKKGGLSILVVSDDNGWESFCNESNLLECTKDLGAALALFQTHNSAAQFIAELNHTITANDFANFVMEAMTEALKSHVDASEVDTNADSAYYIDDQYATASYDSHEFHEVSPGQAEINLVRVKKDSIVIQLRANVKCKVELHYRLSKWDSIDREYVGLTSQDTEKDDNFDTDILVTLSGDFTQGLAGAQVDQVEIADTLGTVDFGELEVDWQPDDYD